jgi:hypothetical protein
MNFKNALSKTLFFLLIVVSAMSCSKNDTQAIVPITLSPGIGFENNKNISIPDNPGVSVAESNVTLPTVGLMADKYERFSEIKISHLYSGSLVFFLGTHKF